MPKGKKTTKVDKYAVDYKADKKALTIDLSNLAKGVKVHLKGHTQSIPIKSAGHSVNKHNLAKALKPKANVGLNDENSQTNSGIINRSQFNDGGFGDIGQQWHKVKLHKANVINNHTSLNLTLNGGGSIIIDHSTFGTDNPIAGSHNKIRNKNKKEHKKVHVHKKVDIDK